MSNLYFKHWFHFGRSLTIFALLCCLHYATTTEAQRVMIQLRPKVTTDQSQVTLADVAAIRTSEPHVERKLAAVDLCDFKQGETCVVSQQLIRLRLALAGFPVEQIQLVGSKEVVVQLGVEGKSSHWSVQDAIALEVAKRIDRPVDEIRVTLLRPLSSVFGDDGRAGLQSRPEIRLAEGPLAGRRSVEVRFFNEQEIYETRSIQVEISIQQEELRMTKPLGRGGLLSPQNMNSHVRFQRTISVSLPFSEIVGRRVRRSMQIGEKVKAADLLPVESNDAKEIVVRQRNAIRLIARRGQLEFIVPRAEAMQNGRIGQVIRVKNLQSNRIVNARLISADEAVVDLP